MMQCNSSAHDSLFERVGQPLASKHLSRRAFFCSACAASWLTACGGGGASSGAALPSPAVIDRVGFTGDPSRALIETSDLLRFRHVFEGQAPGFDTLAVALQRDYLDVGTHVLKGFAKARIGTASNLAQTILVTRSFYAAMVQGLNRFVESDLHQRIRQGYEKLKADFPQAQFAPLSFLVGRLTNGGTVVNEGVGMAVELFSGNTATVASAPNSFVARNLREPADSVLTVIHEAAHVQQALSMPFFNRAARTVLETALIEGGADWVAKQYEPPRLSWRPVGLSECPLQGGGIVACLAVHGFFSISSPQGPPEAPPPNLGRALRSFIDALPPLTVVWAAFVAAPDQPSTGLRPQRAGCSRWVAATGGG
jgi:hypothetical protein